jgi:hypothetical protein
MEIPRTFFTVYELFRIDRLARQSGFVKRQPKKIRPLDFLVSYFLTVLSGAQSLTAQAKNTGLLSGYRISKQAIDQRIRYPFVRFLQSVLALCLSAQVKSHNRISVHESLMSFNRVIDEDSTTIQLPAWLSGFFPGSRNGSKKDHAILKIHAAINLLKESFIRFNISAFTYNDQRAASDILPVLQAGDLILRDLGFFVLSVFKKIMLANAFFISRLKPGVKLYRLDGKTEFNLVKQLKKKGFLDTEVLLGAKEKLRVRLIAIPLADEIAAERRRRYKTNRDRRLNPSKEHLTLLGWAILITNVPSERLDAKQIAEIYKLRWRIEIIFKAWKSYFNVTNVPNANVIRVQAHIYAMLIFITIFQVQIFIQLYKENLELNNKQLSLLKVAQFFKENLWVIVLSILESDQIKEQIFYHCSYEPRTLRYNYAQKILELT